MIVALTGWQWVGIVGLIVVGVPGVGLWLYAVVDSIGCAGCAALVGIVLAVWGVVAFIMLATGQWP